MVDATGFGARLKRARERAGLTQPEIGKEVAKRVGRKVAFSASAVAQWEQELTQPNVETIVAIAAATNSDLGWLMTGLRLGHGGDDPDGSSGIQRGRVVPKISIPQALADPIDYEHEVSVTTQFPCGEKSFSIPVFDSRNAPAMAEAIDRLVIDPELLPARPGSMVFAVVDGHPVVGKLIHGDMLEAGNPDWPREELKPKRGDKIVGTVTEHTRRLHTGLSGID